MDFMLEKTPGTLCDSTYRGRSKSMSLLTFYKTFTIR